MSGGFVRTWHGAKWHVTDDYEERAARAFCGVMVSPAPRRTAEELIRDYGRAEVIASVCRLCRPWIGGKSQFDPYRAEPPR